MNRKFLLVAGVFFLLQLPAHAQVRSFASSQNGGVSFSSASGQGNVNIEAVSVADGGHANASIHGAGINGGFAAGRSVAHTVGGVADSHNNLVAVDGAGAFGDAIAMSQFGVARSGNCVASYGNSQGYSTSSSLANGGYAVSNSSTMSEGYGGGVSYARSESVAHARFPGSTALSWSQADSRAYGSGSVSMAKSLSVVVPTPISMPPCVVPVSAGSYAVFGGASSSSAVYFGR